MMDLEADGKYVLVNDVAWLRAGKALSRLAESLEGEASATIDLDLAAVCEKYHELVWCHRHKREDVVNRLRAEDPEYGG